MSCTLNIATNSIGPEIDFGHLRIASDGLHIAFGEKAALMQNGDTVGELKSHVHVMLDHEHGRITRQAAQDGLDARNFGGGQTCRRLIKQQHLGCDSHCQQNVQLPLLSVRDVLRGLLGTLA